MDTWFTTEPMIHALLAEGIYVIGMVKQLKQTYLYHGRYYTLSKLQKFMQHDETSFVFGSVVVTTKKEGILVKIVFVRNRNKSSECLYILSTDCCLSESEIVRTYGKRWNIELFFKASKSMFKLGREFQSRSYDAMVCHTAIVFTRYTFLKWLRRNENDQKTYGELFFMLCDDIQDMDLITALKSLMTLFVEYLDHYTVENTKQVKSQLINWMCSQPLFIQALFGNLSWES